MSPLHLHILVLGRGVTLFGFCRILFYDVFTSPCFGLELMCLVWYRLFNHNKLTQEKYNDAEMKSSLIQ
jgi:hypothetical protein